MKKSILGYPYHRVYKDSTDPQIDDAQFYPAF